MSDACIPHGSKNETKSYSIELDKLDFNKTYKIRVAQPSQPNESIEKLIRIETTTRGVTKILRISESDANQANPS